MGALVGLMLIGLVIFLYGLVIVALVSVPFQFIGQYKIAVRAGEKCPWLTFIPVANYFLFGKIAEKFQRADNQKSPRYSIILAVLFAITNSFSVFVNLPAQLFTTWIEENEYLYEDPAAAIGILAVLFVMLGLSMVATAVSVVALVFYFKAFHNVCLAFDIDNAKKYLIISICTLGVSIPFHLFAMRHNIPAFTAEERYPKSPYQPEQTFN